MPALRRLATAEDRRSERAGAVGKRFLFNTERAQNAEVHVGHTAVVLAPVLAMLEPQVGSAREQRGKIARVVRRAGATAEENDRIVQH